MQITAYIRGLPDSERQVEAEITDGRAFIVGVEIWCRFRTGIKRHTARPMAWLMDDGRWRVNSTAVIHNCHASVCGWKDSDDQTNSKWTG